MKKFKFQFIFSFSEIFCSKIIFVFWEDFFFIINNNLGCLQNSKFGEIFNLIHKILF